VVEDLGFDAAIDYKAGDVAGVCASTLRRGSTSLRQLGGEILDHALAGLARHARVIICGAISQ